jgi:hypothetical protein
METLMNLDPSTINGLDLALVAVIVILAYRLRSAQLREKRWEETAKALWACIKVSGGGLRALQQMAQDGGERLDSFEARLKRGVVAPSKERT